jgi:hypothetical protein
MSIAKHLMWFTSLNFIKTCSHCFHIVYKLVYIYLNYTCKVLLNSHLQCRGCVWVHIIVTDRTNTHEWSLVCSYKAKLSTHLIPLTSGNLNIIPPLIPVPLFWIYNVHSEGPSWTWSYGSWIYNYLCNQCLSPPMLWVRISIRARCSTLCDTVYQWLGGFLRVLRFPPPLTDRHDITEILLKVALSTIKQTI